MCVKAFILDILMSVRLCWMFCNTCKTNGLCIYYLYFFYCENLSTLSILYINYNKCCTYCTYIGVLWFSQALNTMVEVFA